jgi:hypothetical protein
MVFLYQILQAIRSEYLKLHGVLFAWVEGAHPAPNSRLLIKYDHFSYIKDETHTLNDFCPVWKNPKCF